MNKRLIGWCFALIGFVLAMRVLAKPPVALAACCTSGQCGGGMTCGGAGAGCDLNTMTNVGTCVNGYETCSGGSANSSACQAGECCVSNLCFACSGTDQANSCPKECRRDACGQGYNGASGCTGCNSNQVCCQARSCNNPNPAAGSPKGDFWSASCTVATGWSCDSANLYGYTTTVDLYADGLPGSGGVKIGSGLANQTGSLAIGQQCGLTQEDINNNELGDENRVFSIPIPASLQDGQDHFIFANAVNIGAGLDSILPNSPKIINCAPPCAAVAPSNLTITQGTSGSQAIMNWTPGNPGNGAYTQLIRVDEDVAEVNSGCPTPGDCEAKVDGMSSSTATYTVNNLLYNKTYYFRVVTFKDGSCVKDIVVSYTTPVATIQGNIYNDVNATCSTATKLAGNGSMNVVWGANVASAIVDGTGHYSINTGSTLGPLNLVLGNTPAGYICTPSPCNADGCTTKTSVTSPGTRNYYLTLGRNAWWQAAGAGVYADRQSGLSVTSQLPTSTSRLLIADATKQKGALMKQSTTPPSTGSGAISDTPIWSAATKYQGKKMNYAFFAAQIGLTSSKTSDWANDSLTKLAYDPNTDFLYMKPTSGTATISAPWTVAPSPTAEKYIIFVDGNLDISANLTVNPGAFLAFIVKGKVTVKPAATAVAGIYVMDGSFETEKANPGPDTPLTVQGTVVTWSNANMYRDLGAAGNISNPAEKYVYRPDLLVNMPDVMKSFTINWHEVPPGTFGN